MGIEVSHMKESQWRSHQYSRGIRVVPMDQPQLWKKAIRLRSSLDTNGVGASAIKVGQKLWRNLLPRDFHADNLRRLEEAVHSEAHDAGHDKEPRVWAGAHDGPKTSQGAEDHADVVHKPATVAAAKWTNSITDAAIT